MLKRQIISTLALSTLHQTTVAIVKRADLALISDTRPLIAREYFIQHDDIASSRILRLWQTENSTQPQPQHTIDEKILSSLFHELLHHFRHNYLSHEFEQSFTNLISIAGFQFRCTPSSPININNRTLTPYPDPRFWRHGFHIISSILQHPTSSMIIDSALIYVIMLNRHPLTDGNGRVARAILNAILAIRSQRPEVMLGLHSLAANLPGLIPIALRSVEFAHDWNPLLKLISRQIQTTCHKIETDRCKPKGEQME